MSNDHIFEYLAYYLNMKLAPEYAVMVNGTWGIGKTFAVKKFVRKQTGHGIIYVSLYGARSTDDIDQRIIVGMMPALDTPLGKIGGRIVGAVAQKYGLSEIIKGGDIKSLSPPGMIVFDDLERATMGPVEVLGYVSQLVEQEGRKVVLIGNECELHDRDNYNRVREKVIGITFDFEQDVHSAVGPFIEALPSEAAASSLHCAPHLWGRASV
jgi:hypothetical protein